MTEENASKLWKMIQVAGDYLLGQLPSHPNHPKRKEPLRPRCYLCQREVWQLI